MTRPKLVFNYNQNNWGTYRLTSSKTHIDVNITLVVLGDYWYITQISAGDNRYMIKIIEGFDFKNEVELKKIN